MGYFGKIEEKRLAQKLRKQGLSYQEILKQVTVSKSTLSLWCRDVLLSPKYYERLQQKKRVGARKGSLIGAKKQQQRRINLTKQLHRQGYKEVGKLSSRERFLAGVALYLGDGYKNDKSVGFSNANPQIIKHIMSWLRDSCHVDEKKFRGRVWVHDTSDKELAVEFWSKITDIPVERFHKSYIVKNKTNSKKVRKNIHQYGVFTITVGDSTLQRKILGWMAGLLEG